MGRDCGFGNIEFMISIYMHLVKRRYDLDNHLKVLLDSLVRAYVIQDDSQIHKLYVEKGVVEGGRVVVGILVLSRGLYIP